MSPNMTEKTKWMHITSTWYKAKERLDTFNRVKDLESTALNMKQANREANNPYPAMISGIWLTMIGLRFKSG
jgi:hypothetical protein